MAKAAELFEQRFPALKGRVSAMAAGTEGREAWWRRAEDKAALIERWLSGFELTADAAVALSGVGDGSHLAALLERLPAGGAVFCGEPDVARFKRFLASEGADRLVADSRVYFGVGEMDAAFFAGMGRFPVLEVEGAEPLIFAPLFNEDEGYYSEFFLQFARQLDYWRKLFGTNVTSSGLWQRNSLRNLRALIGAPDLGALKDAFAGAPLVLASAGPSLDESLDFLRWAQERAVVVAVNSSFQALRNAGVDPHFVLAADPNESTDRGFAQVADLGRSILVCPFIVYPGVVARFKGRVATWSLSNELASHLRRELGLEPGAFVTEHGTVSACVFDLAKTFGCTEIYFCGQDLAARGDGRTHASDSFYTDQGANRTDLERCRWLPGNTIESVPVEEKLYVYVKAFEEMARRHGSSLGLRNLSRLGARIEGMPYLSLVKAKQALKRSGKKRVGADWARVAERCREEWIAWEPVASELGRLKDYVEGVCRQALRSAMELESIAEGASEAAERAEALGDELERRLASDGRRRALLEAGQLKRELHDYRRERRQIERTREGPAARLAERKAYCWAVAEGTYHLLAGLEAASEGETAICEREKGESR